MRSALLRGRDHVTLGAVDAVAEGAAAVALCRGGAEKTYPHTDPNEDAGLFVLGEAGVLLAVADGHRGSEAAEVALEHLAAHPGPQWTAPGGVTPETWRRQALAVLWDAQQQILLERGEGGARTTLALALLLPATDRVLYAAVGDSHVFRVRGDQVVDLARSGGQGLFLGDARLDEAALADRATIGVEPLGGARAIVVATDGVSEADVGLAHPAAAVLAAIEEAASLDADLRALHVARTLVERANEAHRRNPSGDNVAVAVATLGP